MSYEDLTKEELIDKVEELENKGNSWPEIISELSQYVIMGAVLAVLYKILT